MSVTAQLADGRTLEFPDGTDPSVVQATVKKVIGASQPVSESALALNSINKGIAGLPDALLNTPNKIMNLGKAAVGTVAAAAGRPDLAPEPTPDPNYARRALDAMGIFRPNGEPQTPRQRVEDAILQGAVGGAVSPAKSVGNVVANVVRGVASGGAAGATKEATGSEPLAIAAGLGTPAALEAMRPTPRPMNDVEKKTLENAQAKKYVVPPAEIAPSFVNKRLQSLAGKDATTQEAANRNQDNTTRLAVEELGFPKGTAITEAKLNSYRYAVAQPYRDVAALSPTAASALEELKQARAEANVYYKHYNRSALPESLQKAQAADQAAKLWDNVIDSEALKSGSPDLPQELAAARTQIAKAYDIERALNLGNADVSAPVLGNALDKGKKLSGNLEVAAKFQQAFPKYNREGEKVPVPGVSKLEAVSAAMLGLGGYGATGHTWGAAAGALPLLAGPTRSLILSKPYQKIMAPTDATPMDPQEQALRSLLITRAIADRQGAQ